MKFVYCLPLILHFDRSRVSADSSTCKFFVQFIFFNGVHFLLNIRSHLWTVNRLKIDFLINNSNWILYYEGRVPSWFFISPIHSASISKKSDFFTCLKKMASESIDLFFLHDLCLCGVIQLIHWVIFLSEKLGHKICFPCHFIWQNFLVGF